MLLALGLAACGKPSTQEQVDDYLEFYYPTTGDYFYDIVFGWGNYLITTHHKLDEQVHPDSEPFRGYITFRPSADKDETGQPPMIYLVTPDGEVWMHANDGTIPAKSERDEVVREGSSTTTTTIRSESEPVILDFKKDPQNWQRYGKLLRDGDKSRLERVSDK
jgi:hypothetical protein